MRKRLVRKDKKIFGVCGGIADYFDTDPTLIRILFVAGFLIFGSGLLLYIVMAIIMPDESKAA
jgi:phage shock protein C